MRTLIGTVKIEVDELQEIDGYNLNQSPQHYFNFLKSKGVPIIGLTFLEYDPQYHWIRWFDIDGTLIIGWFEK